MFAVQSIRPGIVRYRQGTPFPTDITVLDAPVADAAGLEATAEPVQGVPAELATKEYEHGFIFSTQLEERDCAFGLGQAIGPMNRRGKRYRSFCAQAIPFIPDRTATNGAHPFLMLHGSRTIGIFIDYPTEVWFDVGFSRHDELTIQIPGKNFDLYVLTGASLQEIVARYFELVGTPFIPPRWALGYHQSRYSYEDAAEIRELVRRFRREKIPCDAVYMDIDYMPKYKVFEIDEQKFPKFGAFASEMAESGVQLVPIIDPGVRVEDGYRVYEEGKAEGHFCTKPDGSPFYASVWPGYTHFPNYLDEKCRRWWGAQYKVFTDAGVLGFWNDMNEPQFWYTRDGFRSLPERIGGVDETQFLGTESIQFRLDLNGFWMNERDFRGFVHRMPDGTDVNHWDVHNLFALNMLRAGAEGLRALAPDRRHMLISRSSFPGLHRYSGIWTGDNDSWWEHLQLNIRQVCTMNLSGFLFCGSDIGGHVGDASAELLVRWTQLGAFFPLFRNHTNKGSRRQEPWAFDERSGAILRDTIRLRYAFAPYLYSEFMQCSLEGRPFNTPLYYSDPTARTVQIEDQFCFGPSVMVAPIIHSSAQGRHVHLPSTEWLEWKAARYEDRTMRIRAAGDHWVDADLSRIPLYIRKNSLVPMAEPVETLQRSRTEAICVIGFVTDRAEIIHYDDDGETFGHERGNYSKTKIVVEKENGRFVGRAETTNHGTFVSPLKKIDFEVYGWDGSRIELASVKL